MNTRYAIFCADPLAERSVEPNFAEEAVAAEDAGFDDDAALAAGLARFGTSAVIIKDCPSGNRRLRALHSKWQFHSFPRFAVVRTALGFVLTVATLSSPAGGLPIRCRILQKSQTRLPSENSRRECPPCNTVKLSSFRRSMIGEYPQNRAGPFRSAADAGAPIAKAAVATQSPKRLTVSSY